MRLPAAIDPRDFDDRFRLDPSAWSPAVVEVCAAHGLACDQVSAFSEGSNLVASVDSRWVVKIFPPFHRHQWEAERRTLPVLHGRLPVRVPELVAEGCRGDGWPYLILEWLPGTLLESCWASLPREERRVTVEEIGKLIAAVHAIPAGDLATLSPDWTRFIREQAANCRKCHARSGMPEWLLDGLDDLVREGLPLIVSSKERVILTGEYTPFNLLVDRTSGGAHLTGMFDLGDAMIGPGDYDLLGPSLFSCGGDPLLVDALFRGYSGRDVHIDRPARVRLLTLAALHRYANFDFQIRIPAWRARAASLEELATLIWPEPANA